MVTKENWQTELEAVQAEVNSRLIGRKIGTSGKGEGIIKTAEIVFRDSVAYIKSKVEFITGGTVIYNLNLACRTMTIQSDDVKTFIIDTESRLSEIAVIKNSARMEEATAALIAKKKADEEKQLADRKAKEEARYQAHVDKVLSDLSANMTKSMSYRSDFYYTIGWLTAHTKSISATIPDFAQRWFEKTFGSDAPKSVVDSRRKTSGGNSMKWNPSFRLSIKGKLEDMPADVKYLMNGGKAINNTAFIFDLVNNYGFRFGKEQDIDNIIKEIPADRISQFMAGYNGGTK